MNKPSSPPARKASEAPRVIAENRRARFDYFIEERLDAGLVLEGWEVKSLRAGKAQITESHVYVRDAEDLPHVARALEERFGDTVPRLILHAAICRRELAVEIDGVHG